MEINISGVHFVCTVWCVIGPKIYKNKHWMLNWIVLYLDTFNMTTIIFFYDVSGFLYHDNYSFPFKAGLTEDELCNEPIGSPISTKAINDVTTVKFIWIKTPTVLL